MRAVVSSPQFYYVSELFNCPDDSVWMFLARWIMWGATVPIAFYAIPFPRVAVLVASSWALCIVSGIQLEVFDATTPDWLGYVHNASTGIVMLSAVLFLVLAGWKRLAAFWAMVSLVFVVLFSLPTDVPPEVFAAVEYSYLFTLTWVAL